MNTSLESGQYARTRSRVSDNTTVGAVASNLMTGEILTDSISFDRIVETCSDTNHAGYLALRSSGNVIMSDFYKKKVTRDMAPYFYESKGVVPNTTTIQWWNSGQALPSVFYPGGSFDFPYSARSTAALESLTQTAIFAKRHDNEANLLVTMAEAKKTVSSVKRLLQRAVVLFKKARKIPVTRRQMAKLGMTSLDVASEWLEVRYGLRPIYYDVMALKEAYNQVGSQRRNRITSTEVQTDSGQTVQTDVDMWSSWKFDSTISWSTRDTVSSGMLVQYRNSVMSVGDATGLARIGEAAWELVPFSFIVDWFFNTAKYFAAWEPMPSCNVLGTWTKIQHEAAVRRQASNARPYNPQSLVKLVLSGGNESEYIEETFRKVDIARPVLPALQVRLNPEKLVDIAAIIKSFKYWRT